MGQAGERGAPAQVDQAGLGRIAPLDGVERKQIVGQDRKCAVGQPLAVLLAALLIEHVQGQYAEQRDQHQNAEHTAVDAQKDRVHQVSR